jgi:hypothetical protein
VLRVNNRGGQCGLWAYWQVALAQKPRGVR